MNDLVYLVCALSSRQCYKKCSSECLAFINTQEKVEDFGDEIIANMAGRNISIIELRKEQWYKNAIKRLHYGGCIKEGSDFKGVEEELINGVLSIWGQK